MWDARVIDFISQIMATVLGVIGGYWGGAKLLNRELETERLQRIQEREDERQQRKKDQDEGAKNLLYALRAELEEIKGYIIPSAREFPTPYMPVWESAIMSTQFIYLSKVARKELSSIYKKIYECGYSSADTRDAYEEQIAMNKLTVTRVEYPTPNTDLEKTRVYQRHRFTIDRHEKIVAKLFEDVGKVLEMDFWEDS